MEFAYAFTHFLTKDIFEPVNFGLVEAGIKGGTEGHLEIDTPLMPDNGDCRVRMRFVLVDSILKIMAGQAFVDEITGKWLIFDFSNDDGEFLGAMVNVLESLGDALISTSKENKAGGD